MSRNRREITFSGYTYTRRRTLLNIPLRALRKVPDLIARAEYSGSEACYVEVARWSYIRKRWEKFAFEKFFGGEIWEGLGDYETCERLAEFINKTARGSAGRKGSSFIHGLPTFNGIEKDERN